MSRRTARGRLALTAVLVLALVSVFIVRLVDIQVVRAETLNEEAVDKRSIPEDILGMRGDIYDSTGVALADSILRYDITASPKTAVKSAITPEIAAEKLAPLLGVPAEQISKDIRDAVAADADSDYLYLGKKVDVDAFEKIRALEIPWLYYKPQPARTYPNGAVAGNLIGFVGSSNEPQAGVELSEDSCLAGVDGSEVYERSEDGVRIPGSTVTTKQASNGNDLVLTVERDLQWYVQQTLAKYAQEYGAGWGVVVVQEVKTGKLVAVADYPSVDPNDVDKTVDVAGVDALGSRAFTAPFEPGSTFKTLTTASLLDAGLIDTGTHVQAPYRFTTADGADVNDSEYHGTWNLTTTGVLKESSNTGMSQLGLLMPPQQRYDYMKKFGLGQRTEVGFGAEETGYLGEDWDDDGVPDWDPQTNLASMFGQGITVTAVQMASIYQTIANGGVRMPVSLVAGCRLPDGTMTDVPSTEGTRVISESAARSTVDMLENVATKGWLASKVEIPGYRVAMKTGTAQQPDGNGGYSKSYLVSMAGMAPADDPQYVVSVNLSGPVNMNTSAATAPIFRDVMTQVLKEHRVVPSGSSSPDLPTNY